MSGATVLAPASLHTLASPACAEPGHVRHGADPCIACRDARSWRQRSRCRPILWARIRKVAASRRWSSPSATSSPSSSKRRPCGRCTGGRRPAALQAGRWQRPAAAAGDAEPLLEVRARRPGGGSTGRGAAGQRERGASERRGGRALHRTTACARPRHAQHDSTAVYANRADASLCGIP